MEHGRDHREGRAGSLPPPPFISGYNETNLRNITLRGKSWMFTRHIQKMQIYRDSRGRIGLGYGRMGEMAEGCGVFWSAGHENVLKLTVVMVFRVTFKWYVNGVVWFVNYLYKAA